MLIKTLAFFINVSIYCRLKVIFIIVTGDKLSWLGDVEFARQTLSGFNPFSIRLVTVCYYFDFLKKFN